MDHLKALGEERERDREELCRLREQNEQLRQQIEDHHFEVEQRRREDTRADAIREDARRLREENNALRADLLEFCRFDELVDEQSNEALQRRLKHDNEALETQMERANRQRRLVARLQGQIPQGDLPVCEDDEPALMLEDAAAEESPEDTLGVIGPVRDDPLQSKDMPPARRRLSIKMAEGVDAEGNFIVVDTNVLPDRILTAVGRNLRLAKAEHPQSWRERLSSRNTGHNRCMRSAADKEDTQWTIEDEGKLACRTCFDEREPCLLPLCNDEYMVLPLPDSVRAASAVAGEEDFYIRRLPSADSKQIRTRTPWPPRDSRVMAVRQRNWNFVGSSMRGRAHR